jgi:hypothetical protein
MRAAARFQRHLERRQTFEKTQQFTAPQIAPQYRSARAINPCSVNTDLDVSMAMRVISVMDGLQFRFRRPNLAPDAAEPSTPTDAIRLLRASAAQFDHETPPFASPMRQLGAGHSQDGGLPAAAGRSSFQVEGTPYISVQTDQKQSRSSRMPSRSSVPVYFPVTSNLFPAHGNWRLHRSRRFIAAPPSATKANGCCALAGMTSNVLLFRSFPRARVFG